MGNYALQFMPTGGGKNLTLVCKTYVKRARAYAISIKNRNFSNLLATAAPPFDKAKEYFFSRKLCGQIMVWYRSFETRASGFILPIALALLHLVSSELHQHSSNFINNKCRHLCSENHLQHWSNYSTQSFLLHPITIPNISWNKNGYLLPMVYSMAFRPFSGTSIERKLQQRIPVSRGRIYNIGGTSKSTIPTALCIF